MELKGSFKSQQPIIERNSFKSRRVWIKTEDNPQYPQTIEVEVQQANVNLFDNVSPGAAVTLQLNLRGREWEKDGKTSVFNTLVCWKVETASAQVQQPAASTTQAEQPPAADPEGKLPF